MDQLPACAGTMVATKQIRACREMPLLLALVFVVGREAMGGKNQSEAGVRVNPPDLPPCAAENTCVRLTLARTSFLVVVGHFVGYYYPKTVPYLSRTYLSSCCSRAY